MDPCFLQVLWHPRRRAQHMEGLPVEVGSREPRGCKRGGGASSVTQVSVQSSILSQVMATQILQLVENIYTTGLGSYIHE